ncbi:hypothetical protein FACS1894133_1980 [Clostridia bacterium]|nr:hypothetical protein FACS1894133_1980 [Clostridia bacterium]
MSKANNHRNVSRNADSRNVNNHRKVTNHSRDVVSSPRPATELRAEVTTPAQFAQARRLLQSGGISALYAPFRLCGAITPAEAEHIICIPPLCFGELTPPPEHAKHILCRTIGHIAGYGGLVLHGGASLNISNDSAAAFYGSQGLCDIIVPTAELGTAKAARLTAPVSTGVYIYGRAALMQLRRCPIGKRNCGRGDCAITDRRGAVFPLVCDGYGTVEVENAVVAREKREFYGGFDFAVVRFVDETDIVSVLRGL